jgi:hypothetical protein
MRLTHLVLGSAIGITLIAVSTPAAAYSDAGFDPEGDSAKYDGVDYDISFTRRSVVQGEGRTLKITTKTHDSVFWPGSWVYVDAKLDARGGRQADAVLSIWILEMSGSGCELQTLGGGLIRRGTFRFVGDPTEDDTYFGVTCRVPVHRLHPTKAIRWKVRTIYGNGEPVVDAAPNEGMYD